MTLWSGTIYVRTIRSDNPVGYSGVIFFGYHVNEDGEKLSKQGVQVRVPGRLLNGCKPAPFEFWEVTGTASEEIVYYGKYERKETVVKPTALVMTSCSGEIIREILSGNDLFSGIAEKLAGDLWNAFRGKLYDILDNGRVDTLRQVLTGREAERLVGAWSSYVDKRFISYLQRHGFPAAMAGKFIDRHGKKSKEMLEDDSYRLLSFSGPWKEVNQLAINVFALAKDDPRRLSGAVEEALYAITARRGDTAATRNEVKFKLRRLLFVAGEKATTSRLVEAALSLAETNGSYLINSEGLYQTVGLYVMEATVAYRISNLCYVDPPQMLETTEGEIEAHIDRFESENDIELTYEQRLAVRTCVNNRFSIITGGAGTGKTTVLRCLSYVLKRVGFGALQVALDGKVTNKESHSIADFLNNSDSILASHGISTYVICDEANMLDLKTAYRLFQILPEDIRIILVGDQYQLPPSEAGLILPELVAEPSVPQTNLPVVQKSSTGISEFAAEIRKGHWPSIRVPGVKVVSCTDFNIIPQVLDLYSLDPDRTQVICAVKNNVKAGVNTLNGACQSHFNAKGRPIRVRGMNGHPSPTRFREGDRIIFTRNDCDRDMNGSMGTIIKALDAPEVVTNGDDPVVGTALVDGVERPIRLTDVLPDDPTLDLGYAITCPQGSKFIRIIVPIHRQIDHRNKLTSKILDLTWIYTVLTRAECEVIFVGCQETIEKAVANGPKWHKRVVGFGDQLRMAMRAEL